MNQSRNYLKEGITELDRYLFGEGTHYEIYKKLGAHPMKKGRKTGVYFAVWAPNALSVSLVGDFNRWDLDSAPMSPIADSGIYEIFIPKLGSGELYKFAITTKTGKILFKADPYASYAEYRPGTASITTDSSSFQWSDGSWMKKRQENSLYQQALSIYEVHIGSWRRKNRRDKSGFYTYREAAAELAEYVKQMGYTHVELMGIAEHPFDGSWGYQVTGYYAPTSRYGTPEDFMYLVNHLHKNNIGVILDWVPAHFPKDAHGLADFDGQALYEHPDPRKGEHPDWGTKVFDYGKHEVSNFLIANALFWAEQYHIDALRADAAASMLYLDYGRQENNWIPNQFGGNENLEAVEFFKHLNSIMKEKGEGAIVIAEESTIWPKVTGSPEDGGLGFSFKWNMGWMHDFLEYMKLDPYFRRYNHNKMTFGLTYTDSENFILVLSHDEVVHLKASMIHKMPGPLEEKFANLKAGYTFMFGHPGKKLLFMGQDFGQLSEWSEARQLEWYLTEEPLHQDLLNYVKGLLHLYKKYSAFYSLDKGWDGFQWIQANDEERSIFSFIRRNPSGRNNLLFICNFTPVERKDYRVGIPKKGNFTLLLDSSHGLYSKEDETIICKSTAEEFDNQPYSIAWPLPAYGTAIFKF